MKGPDVVLVNPSSRSSVYQALGSSLVAIEPPVWAGLIATYLRLKGFSVELLDAEALELTAGQVASEIQQREPLLVAVIVYGHQPSASTQIMPAAGAVARLIKENSPEQKVVMVGGHVAALPERSLREEAVDFVCSGEGPVTLSELLQALKGNSSPDLKSVRGLAYWEGETVRLTPLAPLVNELEREMPEIAWDLLPMDRYRAHNWHCLETLERQPYAALYTSLGCPYHCTFCCIQAPFKGGEQVAGYKESVNSYRTWNPEVVVTQIEKLVTRYGVRNIKIADEMFVLQPKHVLGICDRIIERGWDLNIWAYARVDTVREGMVEKLKAAGVRWLAFGIEAANERVRDDVQKGFDQELIFKTIEKVQQAGIHVIGNYIFGLPEDDRTTMQQTLDMALELNCEFANFYSTMAYPGSPLYARAVQESWPLPKSWSGYSQHSVDSLPLPTKYLSSAEVLEFRDQAFQSYFLSPRYLEMVSRKFTAEAAEHIRQMASHRLVREQVPAARGAAE